MPESSGIIGVKIKIMPTSPDVNLEHIKSKAMKIVEQENGFNREYIEEPIAFGLKAIIAFFQWPEEKALEELEEKFRKIKDVNSIQIIDMRKIA
ncbi:elongation factor 1-beta [Candidatus Pacearchaeota archaeon]|nr:elongation factor 1-beta [Candidatus Pacearchaeota archaeon]